jgi:excisionase family DNA binding protein
MKKEESKFISLAEAAKLTNYSQDYISLLCRQGKLRAEKLGRNWVTTKEWVYSYVDNTEGKGESVVPVKIKAAPEVKKNKNEKKESKRKERAFYGQSILEAAFFCFACLVWSVNIFLLVAYWGARDFSSDTAAIANNYAVSADAAPGRADDADSSKMQNEQNPDSASGSADDNLLAFEKETDSSVIEQRTAEIKAALGKDVDAEIYKEFAVVAYKDSPEKKFLYMFK